MTNLATTKNANANIPVAWRWVRLRDVIENAQAGFACGLRDPQGIAQLRMNNLDTRGNFVWNDVLRVPREFIDIEKFLIVPGDVLFNNTNSTELVGKSALFEGYDEPLVYSNHFTRLRALTEALLPDFLAIWLNHQWQQGVFAALCNKWIGQSAVKIDKLLSINFPLPPLSEQRRITGIYRDQVTTVERARVASQSRLEAVKTLPSALLRQVFPEADQPLSFGWRWSTLGDLCEGSGQYGTSKKSNGEGKGIPILGMYHIHDGRIRWENVAHIELPNAEASKYILKRGDLLFNRTNSAELVGKTAVYQEDTEAVFASYLIRYRIAKDSADPHYVCAYINSRNGRAFIERKMGRAIGQANISASTMHKMPIPTPNIDEQGRIARILGEQTSAIQRMRQAIEEEAKIINAWPPALLRQVFKGEI